MADKKHNSTQVLVHGLNGLLADYLALYLKTKNFHWHVAGPRFRDLHLLFDEQAAELIGVVDLIGERVRKNGAATITSIGAVAASTRVKDQNDANLSADAMVEELRADNAALVRRDLDFARLEVWPNDDRIVPEDHEASNTGKLRALLEAVGAQVVALGEDSAPPHFALTWLGMGDDGHIASLFPNTDPDPADPQAVRRLTPDPLPPHAPFDRITLTIPALLDCDALLFVIRGDAKRAVFDGAVAGAHDLPVARLLAAGRDKPVTCFT